MKRFLLLCFILILFSTAAQAQYVSTRLGAVLPQRGMYYDIHQGGSGLFVDFDSQTDSMFMSFASYDAAGNQQNYFVQPVFVPSDESTRASSGVIGTANTGSSPQPFYVVTNGQCPGCPYRAQTITVTPYVPTFTWHSSREVDMSFPFNGTTYTYHMQAVNLQTGNPLDDDRFLPGTWSASMITDTTGFPNGGVSYGDEFADLAIMQVVPAPFTSVHAAAGSDPSLVLPPAGAKLYVLQCAQTVPVKSGTPSQCNAFNGYFQAINDSNGADPVTAEALLWYDPATGNAGVETVKPDGTVGPANLYGALYITPDSLTAHLQMQGHNAAGSTWYQDGQIMWNLTLARVPDATMRDCFDYNAPPSASNNYTNLCD